MFIKTFCRSTGYAYSSPEYIDGFDILLEYNFNQDGRGEVVAKLDNSLQGRFVGIFEKIATNQYRRRIERYFISGSVQFKKNMRTKKPLPRNVIYNKPNEDFSKPYPDIITK